MDPHFQDVNALGAVLEDHVRSEFTDGNGHMNVRHIYAFGVTGADLLAERSGINDTYRSTRRMGTFATEHHIRFFAELRENDRFSVHPLWIDRSARVAHVVVFVLNRTTRQLSSALELIVLNVDLDIRSSVPFPPDVAAEIDRSIATALAMPWRIPTSGVLGVRRR